MDESTDALSQLVQRRSEVRDRLVAALAADDRVVSVWLLGSFGRGEADEWSDLDLQVAVRDDALAGIVADPDPVFRLAGEPLLVQAGWPSTSFPGGRFWLVYYDGPVEIDWSIGPLSSAMRERASVLLVDKTPILLAAAPARPGDADLARTVRQDLEFFWAMAPIALKYVGRGHTRNGLNMVGLMHGSYHRLWRAVWCPDQLGRGPAHGNLPIEVEFEPFAVRFDSTISLDDVLSAIDRMCAVVESLHQSLAEAGHRVPHSMPDQVRTSAAIAKHAIAVGGTSPKAHSRR